LQNKKNEGYLKVLKQQADRNKDRIITFTYTEGFDADKKILRIAPIVLKEYDL